VIGLLFVTWLIWLNKKAATAGTARLPE